MFTVFLGALRGRVSRSIFTSMFFLGPEELEFVLDRGDVSWSELGGRCDPPPFVTRVKGPLS